MSSQSIHEWQSHTAATANTVRSHGGSKRASPNDEDGFRNGSPKRICLDTAYNQDSFEYQSGTSLERLDSLDPLIVEGLSPVYCLPSATSSPENFNTPSQSLYGISRSTDETTFENFTPEQTNGDDFAVAGQNSFLHPFPSIEITDADLNHTPYRSLDVANASSQYDISGFQCSAETCSDSLAILTNDFTEYQETAHAAHVQDVTPDYIIKPSEAALPVPPCDTCFGVVLLTFQSLLKVQSHKDRIPVKMTAYGDMIELRTSDSEKYAGIVEAAALSTLLQNPNITLTSTLSIVEKDKKIVKLDRTASATNQIMNKILRIVVSGQKSEKQSIGELLSEAELYLQHPLRDEIVCMTYDNPHFLLRPGAEMPSIEQLSIMSDSGSEETPDFLDEANISMVMRVFDSESVVATSLTDEVSERLTTKLKDHQHVALAMMQERECGIVENTRFPPLWQCFTHRDGTKRFRNTVTGIVEKLPKPLYGGILADEMGLGKTLSIIALICWSLDLRVENRHIGTTTGSGMTLVVAPKSTINGWQQQLKRHVRPGCIKYAIFHGTSRSFVSKSTQCNIVLTTYETLRSDWSAKKILYSQQWERIVLDEAHHIRSPMSQTFKAACELNAQHRWCLSGTPICNSLTDYSSLLTFIGVQPFADRKAFTSQILKPIKEKRPEGLRKLENLVRATCLRRKKSQKSSKLDLPTKLERIHWIDLSVDDQELYKFFKQKTAKLAVDLSLQRSSSRQSGRKNDANIVTLINILRRICDHGEQLLPSSALGIWNEKNGDLAIPARLEPLLTVCDMCKQPIDQVLDTGLGCEHIICTLCLLDYDTQSNSDDVQCPKCAVELSSDIESLSMIESPTSVQPSAKILALIHNLNRNQSPSSIRLHDDAPAKSLVFSIWTKMLDLVQHHLENSGFSIARIDGSCSLQQRSQAIKRFTEEPSCTIMLASIGSAGEGIDLSVANNVHLLEPHWNPMQEAQAIDRVHRIGQQREVQIVRYLTRNSIETYVQWIQQEKIRLINQTLDSVHISQSEIDEKRWQKLQQYIGSLDGSA